ncbi:unnamed protein product [Adineta steineri]|uniref:Uncharacterized protein n=1 Tax=Adineta steineri TaxID=433720 RepID=A0A813T4M1_9BILA|nr:unnamed protein product [Adineta steineri]
MIPILVFLILSLNEIHGKFLTNPESSSFVLLRHIRLLTNDEPYYIRCPYNLNHLTLQLLNYSNAYCSNLYSTSNNNQCQNHQSPCRLHAKRIQLHCNHHSYSNHVDVSYQCSYKTVVSPPIRHKTFTLHALSFPTNFADSEESIVLFVISFGIVITLWIFICCICFIRCRHANEKCQLLSYQSYPKVNHNLLSKKNNSKIADNICLHVDPYESNHISSLRTIQFAR